MLKISIVEGRNLFSLVLEGTLVAPWANELRSACKQAKASLHGRQFVVEIKNLTAINQAGQNVLLGLMNEGVRFRGCGVFTKHMLRQLARRCESADRGVQRMTAFKNIVKKRNNTNEYATSEDFKKIFDEDLDSLHQLAFLLTRDRQKADQCFVSGLDDAVKVNSVFKPWARSWARRAIIKNAIRELRPQPGFSDRLMTIPHKPKSFSACSVEATRVLALDEFERFVFVVSVLERYSEQECALLLGCLFRDVHAARAQAIRRIGDSLHTLASVHKSFQLQEM